MLWWIWKFCHRYKLEHKITAFSVLVSTRFWRLNYNHNPIIKFFLNHSRQWGFEIKKRWYWSNRFLFSETHTYWAVLWSLQFCRFWSISWGSEFCFDRSKWLNHPHSNARSSFLHGLFAITENFRNHQWFSYCHFHITITKWAGMVFRKLFKRKIARCPY